MSDPFAKKKFTVSSDTTIYGVIVVIIAAAAFFGGMAYQKGKQPKAVASTSTASTAPGTSQRGYGSGGGRFARGNATVGSVTAISSTSITVKTNAGDSKTFAITSSTTITDNGQTSSVSDVATGDIAFVMADTTNTSNAARITLNPSFGGGFGGQNQDAPSTQSN